MSARELVQVLEQESSVQVLERVLVQASEWELVPASEQESSEIHQFRGVGSGVGKGIGAGIGSGVINDLCVSSPKESLQKNQQGKCTGHWSPEEKLLFLHGLKQFGRGRWKNIKTFLSTR